MVEALEAVRVAAALAADLGAAVRARVQERAHHAVLAAHEDDPAQAELAHAEVARLGDLGLVAEVDPRAVEDALALRGEHLRIEERLPAHAEEPVAFVVVDVVHDFSAGFQAQ